MLLVVLYLTQAFADQDSEQDQPDWVQSVIQKTILKMIREHEKASKSIMLSKLLKETKAGPLASNHPVFIRDDDRKKVKESWDGFRVCNFPGFLSPGNPSSNFVSPGNSREIWEIGKSGKKGPKIAIFSSKKSKIIIFHLKKSHHLLLTLYIETIISNYFVNLG